MLKSLSHTKPHFPSAKKILDRLTSLSTTTTADSNSEIIQFAVAFEYYPFKKVLSIPNGTCAFFRPEFNHGIALLTWEKNTPENLALARSIGRELASIVATGQQEYIGQVVQGYGNYGFFFFSFFSFLYASSYSNSDIFFYFYFLTRP